MNVRKFRKRPVVIEAVQYDGSPGSVIDILDFANSPGKHKATHYLARKRLVIHTLEGQMTVSVGDWVIKGVSGEFYPCKPDIFLKTYETVNDDEVIKCLDCGGNPETSCHQLGL